MTKGRRRIDAARLADRAGRAANGFAPPEARTRGASPGKGEGRRMRRGRNGRRGLFRIPRSFNPPAARTRGRHPAKAMGSADGTEGMAYLESPGLSTRPQRGRGARHPAKARGGTDGTEGMGLFRIPRSFNPPAVRTRGRHPAKAKGSAAGTEGMAYLESPGLSTRPRRRTGKAAVGRANFCRREKTQRPAPFAMERGRVGFGPKALTVGTAGVIRTHRAAARSHGHA